MSLPTDNNLSPKEYNNISKYKEIKIIKNGTLLGPRTSGQCEPGRNCNKGVIQINSPFDDLVL